MLTQAQAYEVAREHFNLRAWPEEWRTHPTVQRLLASPVPNAGISAPSHGGGRWIVFSDTFTAWVTLEQLYFVLGHEAGHTVHDHDSLGEGRTTEKEMEADVWGFIACELAGVSMLHALTFLRLLQRMRIVLGYGPDPELWDRIEAARAYIAERLLEQWP